MSHDTERGFPAPPPTPACPSCNEPMYWNAVADGEVSDVVAFICMNEDCAHFGDSLAEIERVSA